MTMLASEPAICHKCGRRQFYTIVITWNTFLNPTYPASNKCVNCGEMLNYDDIDLETCTPRHREQLRHSKIMDAYNKRHSEYENTKYCPKCGNPMSYCISMGLKYPDGYSYDDGYYIHKACYECECGEKIYDDKSYFDNSELYEFVDYGVGEHEYIYKNTKNHDKIVDDMELQMAAELKLIESELIESKQITTREEEEEYSKKYYGGKPYGIAHRNIDC